MRIAVVGAGTMGHGIAQVAAVAGYQTRLTDANLSAKDAALARVRDNLDGAVKRSKLSREDADAALHRLAWLDDLGTAVEGADLVIEAIVEQLDAKQHLFRRLDGLLPPGTVLATNTSSLSVSRIAEATGRAERVVGMHFFNPVHIMKLVEIVTHERAAQETVGLVSEVARRMGKDPIVVRDAPGFASSRLGVVLGLEAMRMVEQRVASPEDIDKAMELGYGHPMGPLRVSDLVGLDVRLAIAEYLFRELRQPHYEPPAILRDKVRAGELGKKTGKGFYQWPREPS
ncbi:MAG: 3-hydroxybutyryl-CoA dehydrogenase [Gemmatimonadetes bacterium RIFCSPLOWO2_12_FULL_68_9]|nr:MAG: 3-hydroxybutyryl-CoA dehydrogenase [Gemmatimonadetes bacterium RIFCSPLOWO2_12_FULL_68_9]